MRMIRQFLVVLLLSMPAGAAMSDPPRPLGEETRVAQHCVSGACFDLETRLGDAVLPMRGAGLLRYLGFRVYSAALYVQPGTGSVADRLAKEPMVLTIHYHRAITRKDFMKSTRAGFEKNPDVRMEDFEKELKVLESGYQDVSAGDRYSIAWQEGRGLTIALNGVEKMRFENEEFARAYLGIWLGTSALSDRMRTKLTTPVDKAALMAE